MNFRLGFLFALLFAWGGFAGLQAQQTTEKPIESEETEEALEGAYCNVFYIKSYDLNILPLDDVCFIADEYHLQDAKTFRCVGPIEGPIDLFRHYPWAMHFYLPYVNEGERLKVEMPKNLLDTEMEMEKGTFFISLSDNRGFSRYDEVVDKVDYATVSGTARLTQYEPMSGDMTYPEYALQMDLRLQKVVKEGQETKFVGPKIRLKMVLLVEALE